ncbi:MAG: hypothetical protein K2J14_01435 [Treponemataceae bacterium]|nr:hypothetical protein [Treponemataceae bacterium]
MKKAKKTSLQAMVCAAFAAAMVLAGCDDGGVGSDIIEVSGYNATIDCKNDTTGDFYRDLQTLKNTHSNFITEVKIDNTKAAGTSVMGCVFGEKEKDGKRSFYLVGVQVKEDKPRYYISYFEDVTEEQITANGISFGTEYGWVESSSSWAKSVGAGTGTAAFSEFAATDIYNSTTAKLDLCVGVRYNEDTKEFEVGIYKPADVANVTDAANLPATKAVAGATIGTYPGSEPKNYIGYYVNINKGCTLTGSWTNKYHLNAEVAEAE